MMGVTRWFFAYFIAMAFGAFIVCLCYYRKKNYELCTKKVTGKIVKVNRQIFNSGFLFHPVDPLDPWYIKVEYWIDGECFKATSICATINNQHFRIGKEITVFYNLQNKKICIDEFSREQKVGIRTRDFMMGRGIIIFGATVNALILFAMVFDL